MIIRTEILDDDLYTLTNINIIYGKKRRLSSDYNDNKMIFEAIPITDLLILLIAALLTLSPTIR